MTIEQWKSLPEHYRYAYKQRAETSYSVLHELALIGAKGGCHLHLTDYGTTATRSEHFHSRYNGGIEMHYRTAEFAGRPDTPPSHDYCHLIKGPCWHDGSSLWVEKNVKNFLQENNIKDEYLYIIFRKVAQFADNNFRSDK